MDNSLKEIIKLKSNCTDALKIFEDEKTKNVFDALEKSINKVAQSWSGSWMGYQAYVYYTNFSPPAQGENFSIEWGFQHAISNPTSENWIQYNYDEVISTILKRANISTSQMDDLGNSLSSSKTVFQNSRSEFITLIEIIYNDNHDKLIEKLLNEATNLKIFTQSNYIDGMHPTLVPTRDSLAYTQGFKTPPHISLQAYLFSLQSIKFGLDNLIICIKKSEIILEKHTKETSIGAENNFIFIGHGHSSVWKELKDFLQDRLKLKWEEFNRESTAGYSHSERLQEMLNNSKFAFIIMTAEEDHPDGKKHARENVIHEIGLFQSRLGFKKAIVLLEEGCTEFSNILGLGQIRFPKGEIRTIFEDIRKVLEREKIL